MATIDIALPDDLMAALAPPVCADLQLPSFSAEVPSVTLPIGGSLQGVADFTRGIPTDCSMNFSLMVQLAPIMASMKCLLNILKFITTILSVLKDIDVTNPIKGAAGLLTAIPKIINAAEDVAECVAIVIPIVGQACFVKSLLALIASMLLCTVKALESILNVLGGLQIQLSAAHAAGNTDLIAALQCAQQNANMSAAATMQSMQPIIVLLELAQPFLDLVPSVNLDVSLPAAIDPSDLAAMQGLLTTLGTVAQDIKTVADAIPCPS
jgi:hypothetical protein